MTPEQRPMPQGPIAERCALAREVPPHLLTRPIAACYLNRMHSGHASVKIDSLTQIMDNIFGPGAWETDTQNARITHDYTAPEDPFNDQSAPARYVAAQCVATVRAYTRHGVITRSGLGGDESKSKFNRLGALDLVIRVLKGASTSAIKRAIMAIGPAFGMHLSSKDYDELAGEARAHAMRVSQHVVSELGRYHPIVTDPAADLTRRRALWQRLSDLIAETERLEADLAASGTCTNWKQGLGPIPTQ